MLQKVITRNRQNVPVRSNSKDLKILEYLTATDFKNMDLVVAQLNGNHPRARNKKCTLFYYILNGHLNIEIENQEFFLKENDFITIPPNKIYQLHGESEFLVISSPAFNLDQYELL